MIDNIELIKPLLKFESGDDFYYLQILQRKKENAELGSNSRVIKNYYISSIEYLENKYDEIKKLCELFNARASLRLNKRSYRKVAFKTLENIANTMQNENEYLHIKKSYDRACGLSSNETTNKKWILDIDNKEFDNFDYVYNFADFIKGLRPNEGTDKTICKIPTKNGFHIITNPFDIQVFKKEYPEIDIHKDNPTLLFMI